MTKKKESLEAFRYEMLIRGYMNKTQLQRFMDCGWVTMDKAYNAMLADADAEGIERLHGGHILTKRAIAYLGLTEKKIIEAYERQKEKEAGQIKSAGIQRTQPHSITDEAA